MRSGTHVWWVGMGYVTQIPPQQLKIKHQPFPAWRYHGWQTNLVVRGWFILVGWDRLLLRKLYYNMYPDYYSLLEWPPPPLPCPGHDRCIWKYWWCLKYPSPQSTVLKWGANTPQEGNSGGKRLNAKVPPGVCALGIIETWGPDWHKGYTRGFFVGGTVYTPTSEFLDTIGIPMGGV